MNVPGPKVHDRLVTTYGTVMMRHSERSSAVPAAQGGSVGEAPWAGRAQRTCHSKRGCSCPRVNAADQCPHTGRASCLDHGTPAVRQTVTCYQLFLKSRSCVLLLRSFGFLVCRAFELAGKSRRPARRFPKQCHGAAGKNDSRGPCADMQEPSKHAAVHQPHR